MSGSKHFNKIAWTVTAFILILTILFMNGSKFRLEVKAHTMGYEKRLFDNTKVHTIDIVMNDWDDFIDNATSEEYYTANLVIDGESFKNIAIRGKGNTSLSTVAGMNSERYSFKVEFDHYNSSLTYHGLDKLSLNNLIQDTTMMKDYLTYTMMKEFDVTAPLCSFASITVNGEEWGLYLAVEGVEDGFLERNYGSNYGKLYKPDSMSFGGGRGNGENFNMDNFINRKESTGDSEESMPQMPDMSNFDPSQFQGGSDGSKPDMTNFDFSQIPSMTQDKAGSESGDKSSFGGRNDFGGFGGFGMGSSDVKLQYVDDDIDSYSNIWNNAKTDITKSDQKRLINSLKKLSKGEDIETVVDIEQVIRYFVVHNYVNNGDSYTGSMIHNYYLYEKNGRMAMIPWDYNLAFGTFQSGNAQSTINILNIPIDSPISGGSAEDRPMWNWIVSNDEYIEMYHMYFTEFLNTVDISGIIDDAYKLIKSYVAKDPTAFYSYEEFETGVETLRQYCSLRSESISMQLANDETTTTMNYVDASGLTLSDMGSMGGGFGGMGGNRGGFRGQMPEDFDPSQIPGGFGGSSPDQSYDETDTTSSDNSDKTDSSLNNNRPSRDNTQMPGGSFHFNMNGMGNTASSNTNLIWLAVLVLGAGIIIAKVYKN